MYELEQLEEMFAELRARTEWDVNGPLVWDYFFTDPSKEMLQAASDVLTKAGYSVVSITPFNDMGWFLLRVQQIEHHTPVSLFQRNAELGSFVLQHGLGSYNGMEPSPLLQT